MKVLKYENFISVNFKVFHWTDAHRILHLIKNYKIWSSFSTRNLWEVITATTRVHDLKKKCLTNRKSLFIYKSTDNHYWIKPWVAGLICCEGVPWDLKIQRSHESEEWLVKSLNYLNLMVYFKWKAGQIMSDKIIVRWKVIILSIQIQN